MTKVTAESLKELLRRVEELEGPDRELDCDLWKALRPTDIAAEHYELWERGEHDAYWYWMAHKDYTASLDAAIELVERVLPGWRINRIGQNRDGWPWRAEFSSKTHFTERNGKTPALAVLSALLNALVIENRALTQRTETDG